MKSELASRMPVIVGGFYRSGTSLVRRLLDAHSRIHCPPEIKFLKDFNGDYLYDDLAGLRFFSTATSMGLNHSDLLRIFGRAYVESRELACQRIGKPRWADKNPENVLYLKQWHEILEGKFIFIFIVRHPMDALSSLNEIGFEKAVPATFDEKVMLLKKFFFSAADYVKEYPERSIVLKYEDIVAAPDKTLISLFNDLGENFEPEILNLFYHRDRLNGIEDPKVAGTRQIHTDSTGRWKSDLTDEQVQIATGLLGNIPEKYGYDSTVDKISYLKSFFS